MHAMYVNTTNTCIYKDISFKPQTVIFESYDATIFVVYF